MDNLLLISHQNVKYIYLVSAVPQNKADVHVCVSAVIRTILLSVISLLNEPNTFSPANVDASVMFRKWRDSKGKDKEYAEIIR